MKEEKLRKGLKGLGHLLFWVAYIALNYYLFEGRYSPELALNRAILLVLVQVPLVYVNIGLLIPKLFSNKRYLLFILAQIVILILSVYLYELISENFREFFFNSERSGRRPNGPPGARNFFNYLLGIFLLLLSTIVEIAAISARKEKEAAQLRSENLNSELKFLRLQINPHFLFNTLNNLYSLATIKSEKTASIILQLSNMLRYNLYEANEKDKVPIRKEIAYIKDYINLFQLKDEQISKQITFEDSLKHEADIAPMLLIPFVENAFKHSKLEDSTEGFIRVKLTVEKQKIRFEVINTLPKGRFEKDETGGIGIENVRKRLELIYPEKSILQIKENAETFHVSLDINL